MQLIFILFISIFFIACEFQSPFSPNKEEINLKNRELDAKIEQQKNELNIKKEIELAKINSEIKKEEILIKKDEISSRNIELDKEYSIIQLSIILLTIVILIISAALFIYFTNRRKDKLRAYEDNLEKYYRQKDREAKLQIANKIVDAISSGKLNKEQESRLLLALSDEPIKKEFPKEINQENDEILELPVIEKKKKKKKKKVQEL